jgi:hypothetical protein
MIVQVQDLVVSIEGTAVSPSKKSSLKLDLSLEELCRMQTNPSTKSEERRKCSSQDIGSQKAQI